MNDGAAGGREAIVDEWWRQAGNALHQEWQQVWLGPVVVAHLAVRLPAAALLGGVLGFQREQRHKHAGMRTLMLVSLSAALFVLAVQELTLADVHVSRVVQGVAVGVGFLGSGVIIKLNEQGEVRGLTTAAASWMTAAVGVAVGLGQLGVGLAGTVLAFVILALLGRLERWLERPK